MSVSTAYLIELGQALEAAGFDLAAVASALVAEQNYPDLTAAELLAALRGLRPGLDDAEATSLLTGTGHYTSAEIEAALSPPSPTTKMAAVGRSYGNAFDDASASESWGPITGLDIVFGNIFNGMTVHYADNQLTHGGTIGASKQVRFEPGDVLTGVSGFYGSWFGATTILQVTFATAAGRSYGPYGNMEYAGGKTAYSFEAPAGQQILSFHGAARSGVLAGGERTQFMSLFGVTVGVPEASASG